MIRAVIDQQAFEQLVAGKPTTLIANSDIPRTELLTSGIYKVELILADIGFQAMLDAIFPSSASVVTAMVDLLAACKAMLECTGVSENWNGETERCLKMMEAAVAKAEGTTEPKPKKELPEDYSDYCVERDKERQAARDSERTRMENSP